MGLDLNLRISLCMIVRNEEAWIKQCLESVKAAVDEIIIVDTGSTDRTMDICQENGATVAQFPWSDSFAAARNYGLQLATGDWILWMDADEEMNPDDAPLLREGLSSNKQPLAFIHLINYYGPNPPNEDRSYLIKHHRLFRNKMGFKFIGDIHEQLNVFEVLEGLPELWTLPISIYHYGYLDAVTSGKKKFERNLRLLQIEKLKEQHSPWVDYHIASEYYRVQEYRKAFEHVNLSIRDFINQNQTPPSLLYKLKYETLLTLGSFDGAWPAIDLAIRLYPDYVDLHFYKGVIFFTKEWYEEALPVFRHCLELGENHLQHLTLRGLGTFQAWYYLGRCFEATYQLQEAAGAYRQAIHSANDHPDAAERLNKLTMKASEPK